MSKTVTKADIAKSICAQSDMKQQHAKKVLDAMLGIMKKALKEEKEMLLSGFGKFEAFTKKNRKGRNPQTGAEITIEASKLPAFKAGKALIASINPNPAFTTVVAGKANNGNGGNEPTGRDRIIENINRDKN